MCENHIVEKEIVRFTSDEGSKRHLPPWMLPKVGATAIHVSKSDNIVENSCTLEKGSLAKAPDLTANAGRELKKKTGTGHKRETSTRKSHIHAKCEVKRRRKLSQHDASSVNITQKDKKKKDSSKDRVQKSSLKKSQIVEDTNRGRCDVYSVQAFVDDDIELTVEDLMVIAEEYVKDYENKGQQQASGSQCDSVKQFPATSESGSSLDSHCEHKRSSTPAVEALYDSALNKTGKLVAAGITQTGDPARDMLDLFLGPLLKKPLEEEMNKSIIEGMEFTHEFTRQSQDEHAGEEMVPLMKKKSSLKEKVAMLLD